MTTRDRMLQLLQGSRYTVASLARVLNRAESVVRDHLNRAVSAGLAERVYEYDEGPSPTGRFIYSATRKAKKENPRA